MKNYCRGCGSDFASVAAFDRHRVGVHAYTYSEGVRMQQPMREDGRRCLDAAEMTAAGMELDGRGRWRIPKDAERIRRRFARTASVSSVETHRRHASTGVMSLPPPSPAGREKCIRAARGG